MLKRVNIDPKQQFNPLHQIFREAKLQLGALVSILDPGGHTSPVALSHNHVALRIVDIELSILEPYSTIN